MTQVSTIRCPKCGAPMTFLRTAMDENNTSAFDLVCAPCGVREAAPYSPEDE